MQEGICCSASSLVMEVQLFVQALELGYSNNVHLHLQQQPKKPKEKIKLIISELVLYKLCMLFLQLLYKL